MSTEPTRSEPWQWPEETWRKIVGRARAGRSLTARDMARWRTLCRGDQL